MGVRENEKLRMTLICDLSYFGDTVDRAGEDREGRRLGFLQGTVGSGGEQVDGKIKSCILNRIEISVRVLRHPNDE